MTYTEQDVDEVEQLYSDTLRARNTVRALYKQFSALNVDTARIAEAFGQVNNAVGLLDVAVDLLGQEGDRLTQYLIDEDNALSERTGQLRKLAAHAAYAVNGVWPTDDPWPNKIDELCEKLKTVGRVKEYSNNNESEDEAENLRDLYQKTGWGAGVKKYLLVTVDNANRHMAFTVNQELSYMQTWRNNLVKMNRFRQITLAEIISEGLDIDENIK